MALGAHGRGTFAAEWYTDAASQWYHWRQGVGSLYHLAAEASNGVCGLLHRSPACAARSAGPAAQEDSGGAAGKTEGER